MPLNLKSESLAGKETSALLKDWAPTLNRWAIKMESRLDDAHKKASDAPQIAKSIAAVTVPSSGGGGVTSVGLTMPKEFVSPVSGSPITTAGTLAPAWTTEASNTVFAATPPTPAQQVITGAGISGSTIGLTGTNTISPQVALYLSQLTSPVPSGFTQISTFAAYWQLLSSTTTVSPSQGAAGTTAGWAAVLAFLASNGSTPVFTNRVARTGANTQSFQLGPFTPTVNETIFVQMIFTSTVGVFSVPAVYNVTDNAGNSYVQVASIPNALTGGNGTQVVLFTALNAPANPTTLGFTQVSGPPFSNVNLQVNVFTATNLQQAGPGLPSFQLLQPAQIPFLDASKIASGQIALAQGGTHANLSGTGGAHQFLRQNALGANIDVIQPAFTDLSGIATFGQLPFAQATIVFSATPVFLAAGNLSNIITLTGNVTSSTITGATTGQPFTLIVKQDGVGSRTFVFPTNFKGAGTIAATINGYNVQPFVYDGTNFLATSSMQSFT